MRPPPASASVVLALLLAVGCVNRQPDEQTAAETALGSVVALTHLGNRTPVLDAATPAPPPLATDERPPEHPSPSGSGASPVAAPESIAANEIVGRLEAEGLLVLAVETELTTAPTGTVVAIVSVLHSSGRGQPHQGRYRVTLIDDGGWRVAAVEAAT
jgi:hypothetical protein